MDALHTPRDLVVPAPACLLVEAPVDGRADRVGGGLGVVNASTADAFANSSMQVLPTAYSSLDTFLLAATDNGARVGSLTGNGAHSSVLAKAEFMNELRADTSKFTW